MMRRTALLPIAAAALAGLALSACSSDESAVDSAPSAATELQPAEFEDWLAGIVAAEAEFYAAADGQALNVISEVSDTSQGSATADSTYNADDTFVATSTTTGADGTETTMNVACTVELCFRADESGEWMEVDRALVERPTPGTIATALEEFESTGTVTYTMADGAFRASVDIAEAEGQPAGTAVLEEIFGDEQMVSSLVITVGEDSTTTTSTLSIGEPAPLPDDLP
jgi:outer membrane murein-binding lipoprotein Lpp